MNDLRFYVPSVVFHGISGELEGDNESMCTLELPLLGEQTPGRSQLTRTVSRYYRL